MAYDVIIVGGGLAGCGAAIQLAERGVRVLLLEKHRLPAHKLCGEFLSVEVASKLARLGVLKTVLEEGAHRIHRACMSEIGGRSFEQPLPGTALGVSRYVLDALLFSRASGVGADVRDGTRVDVIEGTLKQGFQVRAGRESWKARVVLGAYGKRGTLDRKLGRPFLKRRSPFVAFKAHYEGEDLGDRVELHTFPGGYCGLSHIERGRLNVCWIAEAEALAQAGGTPEEMIERVLRKNPRLDAYFENLNRCSPRFLAVSQVDVRPKGTSAGDVIMIGDTAGMIAPLCGDGMAMALRSAEIAVPELIAFLRGDRRPDELCRVYDRAWRRDFAWRLRLGRWIHAGCCRPFPVRWGLAACARVPAVGRWLIASTRETVPAGTIPLEAGV